MIDNGRVVHKPSEGAMRAAQGIWAIKERVVITEDPLWFVAKCPTPEAMAEIIDREAVRKLAEALRAVEEIPLEYTMPSPDHNAATQTAFAIFGRIKDVAEAALAKAGVKL